MSEAKNNSLLTAHYSLLTTHCSLRIQHMRILHLLHQYLPEKIGGTELYTRTLAQAQVRQGHEVAIFTPASLPPRVGNLAPTVEEGVRVYRAPTGPRSATQVFLSTFGQKELSRHFVHVVGHETPDLIHIQHLMGVPASIGPLMAKIPTVVTLHDYWYLCANAQLLTNYDETVCGGPRGWVNCARCAIARAGHPQALPLIPALVPLMAYRHLRLKPFLQKAQALIAPTAFTGHIYAQMGLAPEQIHIVPHGLDLPAQLPARVLPRKGLHIAYIGGLSWQKGVHGLVTAVNQLPTSGVKLTIYGDTTAFPDYVAHLKQLAQHPGIHLAGRIPHAQLWQALADVDVVVVPSLWYETASLIVQEAFAMGVPVIASALGALRERVNDGVDGVLVPPGETAVLAHLLDQLRQQPEILERLRAGIQPVFTIQEHVTAVEAIYQNV